MSKGILSILHLYPDEMNIYGDYGNILTLKRRIEWHGYTANVLYHHPGKKLKKADIIVGGGGQDSGQDVVANDLSIIGDQLRTIADDQTPMLMVCGLYQLFGHYFMTKTGRKIPGIGIFDMTTVATDTRLIGNIVTHNKLFGEIIGYENHSGQTTLADTQKPLARVIKGKGNNASDGHEGAIYHNVIGTYLHGSLLPKNPSIADFMIETAALKKFGDFKPEVIDDSLIIAARQSAKARPR